MLTRALIIVALLASVAQAEETNLIGKDLKGWKFRNEKASHWKIAGDVKMSAANQKELEPSGEPGETPILVNDLKVNEHGTDLYSEKEFGDCEIHVELMVPKGSNSGVYVMGRYEVQILDSFGKKDPGKGDLGGIYNTKAPTAENYDAKAPGEWQTFDIVFQAPKFEGDKKTANAKFLSVKLNGKEIHKDVEAPTPTGSHLNDKEVPAGPVMLQGDHGPVAFKNLKVTQK